MHSATRIGRFLTDVAEVIIFQVINLAFFRLKDRYPQLRNIKNKFSILAYGKFGSKEMNFNSDLDLVFLHITDMKEEAFVTRVTQKILHMLTTRYQSGILYAVDTRLRPSGSAGLLVSHFSAFEDYQRHHAWPWNIKLY